MPKGGVVLHPSALQKFPHDNYWFLAWPFSISLEVPTSSIFKTKQIWHRHVSYGSHATQCNPYPRPTGHKSTADRLLVASPRGQEVEGWPSTVRLFNHSIIRVIHASISRFQSIFKLDITRQSINNSNINNKRVVGLINSINLSVIRAK